jgi:hypothetical protein
MIEHMQFSRLMDYGLGKMLRLRSMYSVMGW